MGANRMAYAYLLLLSFSLFLLFDQYLFHLLFLFLLLLPLFSLLFALPLPFFLRLSLEMEDDILPRGTGTLLIAVKNGSVLPAARVKLRLSLSNALGRAPERGAKESVELLEFSPGLSRAFLLRPSVALPDCGRVDIAVQSAFVCDLLGLFSLPIPKRNVLYGAGSIFVLPALQSRSVQIEETADLGLDSAAYSTEKPGGDPAEIFQLRDYRPGDARHSVHWKLSSRMQRLIVKEFGLPLNPSLHFLLELRRDADPAAAEYLIGTALAFSEYLMAREIVHSLSWPGADGLLRTVSVDGADALASALNQLLALPGEKRWNALLQFAAQADARSETHLIYLIAGTDGMAAQDAGAERALGSLLDFGVCRRLTLMPDRCTPEAADRFRALGCEVQLLDGRIPGAEAEAAL